MGNSGLQILLRASYIHLLASENLYQFYATMGNSGPFTLYENTQIPLPNTNTITLILNTLKLLP